MYCYISLILTDVNNFNFFYEVITAFVLTLLLHLKLLLTNKWHKTLAVHCYFCHNYLIYCFKNFDELGIFTIFVLIRENLILNILTVN